MQEIVFHVLFIVVWIREADRLPFVLTNSFYSFLHSNATEIDIVFSLILLFLILWSSGTTFEHYDWGPLV